MERESQGPVYELHRVFTLSGIDPAECTRGRETPVVAAGASRIQTEPASAEAEARYGLTATKSS